MFANNHPNGFHDKANARSSHVVPKAFLTLLGALIICCMSFPVISFGEDANENGVDQEAILQPNGEESSSSSTAPEAPSAPETYITVRYNEHYNHDLDGNPSDTGTRLLAVRSFPATVGETVNTWDYVADIPGFFFWDGWPSNLTVSEDPNDNVIELFYMRLSIAAYTVNYYAMVGADLTADNWAGALATDPQFYLLGQAKYSDQLFEKLVLGDEYAYEFDETYTVGTYPDSIRLTLDPSRNVINVLYAPKMTTGPADIEIVEKPETTQPDEEPSPDPDNPDNEGDGSGEDESVPILPPTVMPPVLDFPDDSDAGDMEITDNMLDNAPSKEQAAAQKAAYESGLADGVALAQTGDDMMKIIILVSLIIAATGAIVIYAWRRQRK